jgi:hypothetical protein
MSPSFGVFLILLVNWYTDSVYMYSPLSSVEGKRLTEFKAESSIQFLTTKKLTKLVYIVLTKISGVIVLTFFLCLVVEKYDNMCLMFGAVLIVYTSIYVLVLLCSIRWLMDGDCGHYCIVDIFAVEFWMYGAILW